MSKILKKATRVILSWVGLGVAVAVGGCGDADTSARKVPAQPSPARVLDTVELPAGTALHVSVLEGIKSGQTAVGTTFSLELTEPLLAGGRTVAAAGSKVTGRVTHMEEAGRVKGRAEIGFTLALLKTDNRAYVLETDDVLARADGTKGRDAVTIGGGAGVGAVVGGIVGGKKGAVIGGTVGGAAGTGVVLATEGGDIAVLPGAAFTFHLSRSLEVQPPADR